MKLFFFDKKNPRFDESIALNILSFLDSQDQLNLAKVRDVALLPTIKKIPMFSTVGINALELKLLAGGMTNMTYILHVKKEREKWVLRIPGKGSSTFINREHEKYNAVQASELKLNVPVKHFDDDGLQLTQFIEGVQHFDKNALARPDLIKKIAMMMKKLHQSSPFKNETRFFERNETLLEELKEKGFSLPEAVRFIEKNMGQLKQLFAQYKYELHPCHNDTTPLNFIISYEGNDKQERIHEIDWEYSSNNDFLWDLVYFVVEAKLSKDQEINFLEAYFGEGQLSKTLLAWAEVYKPIIQWWITIWSWSQVTNGADAVDLKAYSQLADERFQSTLDYLKSDDYLDAAQMILSESLDSNFSGVRSFKI